MGTKIRLGPIAVFLTIIAAVLASLAMLTVATSRADARLAERYADVTKLRYELEADGSRFVKEAEEYHAGQAALPAGSTQMENGLAYTKEKDGYSLEISLADIGTGYDITGWKLRKLWEEDDPMKDLWPGM